MSMRLNSPFSVRMSKVDASPLAQERVEWVDVARGVGIVLVVVGHAWRGLNNAGMIPSNRTFVLIDDFIYAFHMPLFFLLSGLFTSFVLRSGSLPEQLWKRVMRLLYPLTIWTYAFFLLRLAAGESVNNQVAPSLGALMPLPPRDQFWFLWALFLIQAAALVAFRFGGRSEMTDRFWLRAFAVSVALAIALPKLVSVWAPEVQGVYFQWFAAAIFSAPYYLFGAAFAGPLLHLAPARRGAIVAGTIFMALSAIGLALDLPRLLGALAALVLSLCVIVLCSYFTRIAGKSRIAAALAYFGVISLPIYLAHTPFTAAARIALTKLGIENLPVLLIVFVAAGVLGPLLLYRLSGRMGISRLVGFG